VYGVSPRLRVDLVVNNLVAYAVTTGEVKLQSDGSPWRPLVHVEDVCRAFTAALHAPREVIHNEAFNVGKNEDNYQIRDIAQMVEAVVPGSRITYAAGASADSRCYQVDCGKLARVLPEAAPEWSLRRGVESLYEAYSQQSQTIEQLLATYVRISRVKHLIETEALDSALRWTAVKAEAVGQG
jgi:nucleoside-diphosphate-sugar epimerase